MHYWPNPAHKRSTTEAGPPRWHPGKAPCPDAMSAIERSRLLLCSVPEVADDPRSRRYALRRATDGRAEVFVADFTCDEGTEFVFHGYPWHHPEFRPNPRMIPVRVLRAWLDRGDISRAEYGVLIRSRSPW
jgi:hypothetical protein